MSNSNFEDEEHFYVAVSGDDVDEALGLELAKFRVSSELWQAFSINCETNSRAVTSVVVQLIEAQLRGLIHLPEVQPLPSEKLVEMEARGVFRH